MKTILNVQEMTCRHCENAITKALLVIVGVVDVQVDLTAKTVTINHNEEVLVSDMKNAIEEAGYDVQ